MAKDESRTILLVILIGGILYMITKSDEKDKKETKEKQIEAVVKKTVDTIKEAETLIKTKKDQQDEGWWLKLFKNCQMGVPLWYRNIQQLEFNRVRSLDRATNTVVIRWVATIQYLVACMDDYFPTSDRSVRAQELRRQVAELFQMVEYMRNYDVRNQATPPRQPRSARTSRSAQTVQRRRQKKEGREPGHS